MNDSKNQIDKIAAKGEGFTVPQGYFEDFATKMSGRLPYREVLDAPAEHVARKTNSTWMRIRPYVYMAAMFAGAWCLLKMFTLMTADRDDLNLSNYPALAQALEDDQFVNEYIIDDISTYELYEDFYDEGLVELPINAADLQNSDNASPQSADYKLPTDGYNK